MSSKNNKSYTDGTVLCTVAGFVLGIIGGFVLKFTNSFPVLILVCVVLGLTIGVAIDIHRAKKESDSPKSEDDSDQQEIKTSDTQSDIEE